MSKNVKVNYPLFSFITGSASWCGCSALIITPPFYLRMAY